MANNTARLLLPLVQANQAGKEVTLAEALNMLDGLVMPAIINRTTTAAPGSPAQGDMYLVAAAATGVWAGSSGKLAIFIGSAWEFIVPLEGFSVWDKGADEAVRYDGAAWKTYGANYTLKGTATYDPPSIAAGATTTTDVTVTGAALGDIAAVSFSLDAAGVDIRGYVRAADTVRVMLTNTTGSPVDLASGTLTARVTKP